MPSICKWLCVCLALAAPALHSAAPSNPAIDASALGLTVEKQSAGYWLKKIETRHSKKLKYSPQQVESINRKLRDTNETFTDLNHFPQQLAAEQIAARILRISKRPTRELFDQHGKAITSAQIDSLVNNVNLPTRTSSQEVLFGLITRRTSLRTFPSSLRVFSAKDDTDIDRFQETDLFPGAPVAILHASLDKRWLFVVSEFYSAWLRADKVALGSRAEVMAYTTKQPRLFISGANVRTVYTPDTPEVSELVLDMGSSFPLHDSWPVSVPVNGQGSLSSFVIDMPVRNERGLLGFKPVLVPRSADAQNTYLPLSAVNIIQQSFKFIGERYGWGHDYNGRDCSGFVSEIYKSMGLMMPRNTGDQASSMALDREAFAPELTRKQRMDRIKHLQIGDLIYIPGHVMLVIGRDRQGPWVIHDSHASGLVYHSNFYHLPTNSVAVTPLMAMAFSTDKPYIDTITAVQHVFARRGSKRAH